MGKKRKHYPPSRQRYEAANPVISIRVSKDLYAQLKAIKKQSNKSVGDVLREALGLQQADVQSDVEFAYTEGYIEGRVEAEAEYRVDYRCSICGGTIAITTDNEKKAAATCMREHGWRHGTCHNRQG